MGVGLRVTTRRNHRHGGHKGCSHLGNTPADPNIIGSRIAVERASTASMRNLTLPSHSLVTLDSAAFCKSCC